MTGFGEARFQSESLTVLVEIRSVNNRHFKLTIKVSDPYGVLEPELERMVRESVHRGTVQLTIRVDRPRRPEDYRLNLTALESYRNQLRTLSDQAEVELSSLLVLPGVVEERRAASEDPHGEWSTFQPVVSEALRNFHRSRAEEGRAMAEELRSLVGLASSRLELIEARRPVILEAYQDRLTERVQTLVEKHGIAVDARDLIREVAIFAERSDIAEEVIRLKAHVDQFIAMLDDPGSAGRKLEFIVQEMGRETNTIGSKANDIEISREVVEIKGVLERIRELIQNVE